MNLLLVGSGGREHALAWSLSRSPLCKRLFVAPGNAGTSRCGTNVAIDVADHAALVRFCREEDIDLVVIGPEGPLVAGLVDDLEAAGIKAFGPSRAAARLEGSKAFAKELCEEAGIPTARFARFSDPAEARAHVRAQGAPIVVKADGLASGKGVVVAATVDEAEEAIEAMLGGALGEAGREIVVEECLVGEEASFFALVDGEHAIPFASAQDHKRAFDGDEGPNTGGMGAYSPAPVMTPEMTSRVMDAIVRPAVEALAARGTPFRGVLFAGLMITDGGPMLIEFNVRFGDPETQAILPRLKGDLLPVLVAACEGALEDVDLRWRDEAALTVVLASKGYPGDPRTGTVVAGITQAEAMTDATVFQAGTVCEEGDVIATGGRVLGVTALGRTVEEAQRRAYEAVSEIDWPDGYCRTDIGWRAVAREQAE